MTVSRVLRLSGLATALAALSLPLLGRLLVGGETQPLWAFPPPFDPWRDYPTFSVWAVVLLCLLLAAMVALLLRPGSGREDLSKAVQGATDRLPVWGWLSIGWLLVWWLLAWWPAEPLAAWRRVSFPPLWLGLILVFNALAVKRGERPLLFRRPLLWASLFLASAVFWWGFEWLNRFARNWQYLGVREFSDLRYAVQASLSFATVLPAVLAVREWLGTYPFLQYALGTRAPLRWAGQRWTAVALIVFGLAGLLALGAAPLYAFPAVWAGPLALFWGVRHFVAPGGMLRELAAGDFRRAGSWALAALVCGFFWELWNVHSDPQWVYTVPFVEGWHLFEMPLLGYLGYLPFGIVCGLAIEVWAGGRLDDSPGAGRAS